MKKVDISGEYIKLDSFLKFVGKAETGGQAKALVAEGKVEVDGKVCLMRGKKLRNGNVVRVDEEEYEVHGNCT